MSFKANIQTNEKRRLMKQPSRMDSLNVRLFAQQTHPFTTIQDSQTGSPHLIPQGTQHLSESGSNQAARSLNDESNINTNEAPTTETARFGHDISQIPVHTDSHGHPQLNPLNNTTSISAAQGFKAGLSISACDVLMVGTFVHKSKEKGCNSVAMIQGVASGRYAKCDNVDLKRLLVIDAKKTCNDFCNTQKCPQGTFLLPKNSIYRDSCRKENRWKSCPYIETWIIGPRYLSNPLWNCECGGFRCT